MNPLSEQDNEKYRDRDLRSLKKTNPTGKSGVGQQSDGNLRVPVFYSGFARQ